jgi:CheY-like chemotaxis protein
MDEGAAAGASTGLLQALGMARSSRAPAPSPAARILLADDEAYQRRLVRIVLSSIQAAVTEVADGRAVVDMIALRPFDVLLLDMQMPHMNGPEVLVWIRRNYTPWADIPIIGLADAEAQPAMGRLLGVGLTDWTPKPVDSADLLRKLSLVLPAQVRWTTGSRP